MNGKITWSLKSHKLNRTAGIKLITQQPRHLDHPIKLIGAPHNPTGHMLHEMSAAANTISDDVEDTNGVFVMFRQPPRNARF